MKKQLLLGLVSALVLVGCGSSSSSSSETSENNYTLGNNIAKMVASVNAAQMVNFKRAKFYFTKYPDLNAFVENLRESTVCSSGDINITVVNQTDDKCGTYKIVAHNCYYNDNSSLLYDGNTTVTTKNIDGIGCYKTDVNYTSNVSYDRTILGQKTRVEYEKGFVITFSPSTDDSIDHYNITGNGTLDINGDKYVVNNFNIYIDGSSFTFNSGTLSEPDKNLSIRFTEYSSEAYLDPVTYDVKNDSWFMFIYNDNYYSLYNDANGTTTVMDPQFNQISDKYNFDEIYTLFHD